MLSGCGQCPTPAHFLVSFKAIKPPTGDTREDFLSLSAAISQMEFEFINDQCSSELINLFPPT